MKNVRKVLQLLSVVGVVGVASTSSAGKKVTASTQYVNVNTNTSTAKGGMGAAYLSPTTDPEYIGCAAVGSPTASDPIEIECFAENAAGTSTYCVIGDNTNAVAAVASITPDSFVSFSWDMTNTCTMITIDNDSSYPPKNQGQSE